MTKDAAHGSGRRITVHTMMVSSPRLGISNESPQTSRVEIPHRNARESDVKGLAGFLDIVV